MILKPNVDDNEKKKSGWGMMRIRIISMQHVINALGFKNVYFQNGYS